MIHCVPDVWSMVFSSKYWPYILNLLHTLSPGLRWLMTTLKLMFFFSNTMLSNPDDIWISKCLFLTFTSPMKSINLDTSSALSVSATVTKHEVKEIMWTSLLSSFTLRKCSVSLNLTVPLPRAVRKREMLISRWFCLCTPSLVTETLSQQLCCNPQLPSSHWGI